jgi:dipeptidyl aminopeptidase/acylaminoacyl peptidase
MKLVLLVSCTIILHSIVDEQNIRLLEQTKYSVPGDTALSKVADLYSITYLSDGLKVKGYIAIPREGGPHPCVIFNRGGNESYSMLTNESFATKATFLVKNGYLFAASQYRGSEGSEGKDEFGGGDVNDVLNLVEVLGTVPQADTSRVALFGWSRGAINTYVALTRSNKIKTAVVGSGFNNLLSIRTYRPLFDSLVFRKLIPGYSSTHDEDLLKARSAVYIADKIPKTIPILILQGTADNNVPASQAFELANKFYELKQPFRLIVYEGGVHSLRPYKTEYESEIITWLNKYLRDRKSFLSLEPRDN